MTNIKESTSFLKKRSKKLLQIGPGAPDVAVCSDQMDKSFLLLFFKKEVLPSFLSS
jgi:hypothetical protein